MYESNELGRDELWVVVGAYALRDAVACEMDVEAVDDGLCGSGPENVNLEIAAVIIYGDEQSFACR